MMLHRTLEKISTLLGTEERRENKSKSKDTTTTKKKIIIKEKIERVWGMTPDVAYSKLVAAGHPPEVILAGMEMVRDGFDFTPKLILTEYSNTRHPLFCGVCRDGWVVNTRKPNLSLHDDAKRISEAQWIAQLVERNRKCPHCGAEDVLCGRVVDREAEIA